MGTRSLIHFKTQNGNVISDNVSIYTQYDGYLTGVGETLYKFLSKKKIVNGIPGGNTEKELSNGASDLIGQFIYELKTETPIGGIYIQSINANDVGEEFTYTIVFESGTSFNDTDKLLRIIVDFYDGLHIFEGDDLLADFKELIDR